MNLIHTSDLHLGQNFRFRERKKEHKRFLDWLCRILEAEAIDLLIVSGDIFDTGSPPNYALEMYYRFLGRASQTRCRDIVIIGGNHDSAATLNAPKQILESMNVHVVGGITDNDDDEIIVIKDSSGNPEAIVCAVPFLRDRDIRRSIPGESYEDKNKALARGIKTHYESISDAALSIMEKNGRKQIPIIATGHLFAAGGSVMEGEYLRDIHVGSLEKFNVSQFPKLFDYVALGHLHRPQKAGGLTHVRYSGSPIPLSFSEAGNPKEVVKITFSPERKTARIKPVSIPQFRVLKKISGTPEQIIKTINTLKSETDQFPPADPDTHKLKTVWVEVMVSDKTWQPDTEERIFLEAQGSNLEIFAVKKTKKANDPADDPDADLEDLDHITPEDVFLKRLEKEAPLTDELRNEMIMAFKEIVSTIHETDNGLTNP